MAVFDSWSTVLTQGDFANVANCKRSPEGFLYLYLNGHPLLQFDAILVIRPLWSNY